MCHHECLYSGSSGHLAHVLRQRVAGHQVLAEGGRVRNASEDGFDARPVHHFVHQHVRTPGQLDQFRGKRRVAGYHERAVGRVKTIDLRARLPQESSINPL